MLPLVLLLLTSGVTGKDLTANFVMTKHSGSHFEGSFCFHLTSPVTGWELVFSFSVPVKNIQQYDGDYLNGQPSGCKTKYTIVNKAATGNHISGETLCVRMVGEACGSGTPTGTATLADLTRDHQTLPPVPTVIGAQASKYNYAEVLMKSILFYEAQRSGKLPANNRIPWRGDSGLNDKGDNGEDLTGGWYDAGDITKFNFPMAWSTTVLAWGLLMWKDAYARSGQLPAMYDSIKWPLDYFIKCHTKPNELYVQVGEGGVDHGTWTTPEQWTRPRQAYKIDASHPGSDVAMETAAALAAGYLVFSDKGDNQYAETLLSHATEIFDFAVSHQGKYTDSDTNAASYYASQNELDENSWGAMWMYKATGDKTYLYYAEDHFMNQSAWGFSWDEKQGGAHLLLYMATRKDLYKQKVLEMFKDWFPGGSVPYTPKCLAFRLQWGALRYAANTAFLALVAADAGINPIQNRQWAMSQIHYALGDTGRSYVIGFGTNPPQRPHHRGSSCPMSPAPCGWAQFQSPAPNPHTLYGALVGGPGIKDDYTDSRKDYVHNEVSCDYNAGFQSAIAGLERLAMTRQLPSTYKNMCP